MVVWKLRMGISELRMTDSKLGMGVSKFRMSVLKLRMSGSRLRIVIWKLRNGRPKLRKGRPKLRNRRSRLRNRRSKRRCSVPNPHSPHQEVVMQFPEREADIAALALLMVQGLEQAPDAAGVEGRHEGQPPVCRGGGARPAGEAEPARLGWSAWGVRPRAAGRR